MKIELGKYRTRCGQIVEVTSIDTTGRYCVEVTAPGRVYLVTADGFVIHGAHNDYDLAERVPDGLRTITPGRYRMRNGEIAMVEREKPGAFYPWYGRTPHLVMNWMERGQAFSSGIEHPYDLVERVPDNLGKIKPGRYRTRDGRIATVERADGCNMQGVPTQRVHGRINGPYAWWLDGRAGAADEHPYDLVERLPDNPSWWFDTKPEPTGFRWTVWAERLRELASDAAAKVGVPTGDIERMRGFLRDRFADPVLLAAASGDDEAMAMLAERDGKAVSYSEPALPEWAWDQMVAGKRVIRKTWEDTDRNSLRLIDGEIRSGSIGKSWITYGSGREEFVRRNKGGEFKLSVHPRETIKYRFTARANNACNFQRIVNEAPAGWTRILVISGARKASGLQGVEIGRDLRVRELRSGAIYSRLNLCEVWCEMRDTIEVEVHFA